MNRRLSAATSLAVALLVSVVVVAQKGQTKYVNRPVVNMFSSATAETDVVSQAIYATPVTILEEKDGWANIRTPDEYTGWVESGALITPPFPEPYLSATSKVVQVRSLYAHVYREASVTRHAPMLTVPFETKLELDPQTAQKSERWLQVRLPDGRTGFVQTGDVGSVASNLTVPRQSSWRRSSWASPTRGAGLRATGSTARASCRCSCASAAT